MANEQEKSVVQYTSRDGQMIKLSPAVIKKYLVSGNPDMVTPQELYLYMGICKSRGLNPFIKDCYLIKYSPKDAAAIVVSIDYYRKRARAQTDCQGWTTGITLIDATGNIARREGCLLLEGEKLVGAWFEAKPAGWSVPMKKEINLERYIKKTKEGNVTRFWSEENQPEQIAKVVESQGLRATWPDEFQGLYVDAERESMEAQQELGAAVGKEEVDAKEKLKDTLGKPENKAKAPEDKTEADTEEESEAKGQEQSGFGIWKRDNWINIRKPGFSTFVHSNLEKFKDLSADYQAQIIEKWHALYEEPFPSTTDPKESAAPDPELETEGPEDEEAAERLGIIDDIKKQFKEHTIFNAKNTLAFPVAAGVWPPSLDGCRVLFEKCQELESG